MLTGPLGPVWARRGHVVKALAGSRLGQLEPLGPLLWSSRAGRLCTAHLSCWSGPHSVSRNVGPLDPGGPQPGRMSAPDNRGRGDGWPSRNQQNGALGWLSAPPPPCPEQGPTRTPHLSQCPPCAPWPPGIPALRLQGQEGSPMSPHVGHSGGAQVWPKGAQGE